MANDLHELNYLYGLAEYRDLKESMIQLMQSHMERVEDSMLGEFIRVRYI